MKSTGSAGVRTSTTDPIHVSWLPVSTPGRVGITLAPGKHGPSISGAPWRRDLVIDLDRLAEHHRTQMLVCLLEDHELVSLGIPSLETEAGKRAIGLVRLPIKDGGVPPEQKAVVDLVARIRAAAAEGRNVVIHCAAGLGRSGVVGGSVLIAEGKTATEAIAILHDVRGPSSPENDRQKDFLRAIDRHYRAE